MRVAKTLTKFMIFEGNRHRITLAWKDFPFLVAEPESMRGRELERVFESSSFFERAWKRNEMELYFSFDVWTCGFEKRDSRETLALSLREKRAKWGEKFWFVWTRGNGEGESFLDVLLTLKKLVELVHCMAGQVLVFRV